MIFRISKNTSRFLWRRRFKILIGTVIFFVFLGIFSYLTNPFTQYSIIDQNAITVAKQNDVFTINFNTDIHIRDNLLYTTIGKMKSGWHIFINRLDPRIHIIGEDIEDIIKNTHASRFNEDRVFLISGEHFSVLYPRSLGIFYHSLIDPRTALNPQDWENRQGIYLKTLGFTLDTYEHASRLSTTIVPVWRDTVTFINIYAPPSDTLYSLLYGLYTLQSSDDLVKIYPYQADPCDCDNDTKQAAQMVQQKFQESLKRHTNDYLTETYDFKTGLVRQDIYLSSTKDSVKRNSSFHDNVIYWKTHELAQKLGIIDKDPEFLAQMKERIIKTYWLPDKGYFLEELSEDAIQEQWYSSDWLIAYQTGFLDASNEKDLEILDAAAKYIIRNNIDQPFGMRYQTDIRPQQLHRTVRTFAREYGSTAIWSHWGMEYIKMLTRLAQETGNVQYVIRADQQIQAYKKNIIEYGGFPEVYKSEGEIFNTRFYQGMRSTGWIVNYEQAVAMYQWTVENWTTFQQNEVQ